MNSEVIAPVFITVIFMSIPIIAILTTHQRKMTELIHGRTGSNAGRDPAIDHLRAEVSDLKTSVEMLRAEVREQTLMLDHQNSLRERFSEAPKAPLNS